MARQLARQILTLGFHLGFLRHNALHKRSHKKKNRKLNSRTCAISFPKPYHRRLSHCFTRSTFCCQSVHVATVTRQSSRTEETMGQKLANQLNRETKKKKTTSGTEEILSGDGARSKKKRSMFQFVELIRVWETS